MCGIAGILRRPGVTTPSCLGATARSMASTLRHRGPDDSGTWLDAEAGVAIAHRRLSILDVTSCGHQPMTSACGRHVLVFNGEIYNFRDLRARLSARGQSFRSNSDTEVLLEMIASCGVAAALEELVGMFAFAVWDRKAQTLVLARDRMGEKPLYYGWLGSDLVFASELKALRAHPAWEGNIDREAISLYLRYSYVPGPRTIYRGILKLQPGRLLCITDLVPGVLPAPKAYWRLEDVAQTRSPGPPPSDHEAVDALERLLGEVVQQQMVADVPLGAFLSGGVDSATVVAMMQAVSERPVRTFTIGVRDPERDEAPAARAIAEHLKTDHTEQYIHPDDALAVIPQLSTIYDEPFADSSQIPTLLVSRLARQSVTVSLSGDGGDELFAGYERYVNAPRLVGRLGWMPGPLRYLTGHLLLSRPILGAVDALSGFQSGIAGERLRRLGEVLVHHSPLTLHRALHSSWPQPDTIVHGGREPATAFTTSTLPWTGSGFGRHMLIADALTYLPDDLLVKVDRAAMAVSLETRVPLLNHRLVEFAMQLPWHFKVRNGVRKWILRQVLYRHVPQRLFEGPKRGFSIPIGTWLRGPLRRWADSLLDPERLRQEGFFDPHLISMRWRQHLSGAADWSYPIWTILMFQQWYESQATDLHLSDRTLAPQSP
jgi:asparagine synthase (glutamine-hydrolysing)